MIQKFILKEENNHRCNSKNTYYQITLVHKDFHLRKNFECSKKIKRDARNKGFLNKNIPVAVSWTSTGIAIRGDC